MDLKTEEFIKWLNAYLLGKENLFPKQVEEIKNKLKLLQKDKAIITDFNNKENSPYNRPEPEKQIQIEPYNFNKNES